MNRSDQRRRCFGDEIGLGRGLVRRGVEERMRLGAGSLRNSWLVFKWALEVRQRSVDLRASASFQPSCNWVQCYNSHHGMELSSTNWCLKQSIMEQC